MQYPEYFSEFNLAADYDRIVFPKIDSVTVYNGNNYYCILSSIQTEYPKCFYKVDRYLAYSYPIRDKLPPFGTTIGGTG